MKKAVVILSLMAVFAVFAVQAAPQRVRGQTTSSSVETAPAPTARPNRTHRRSTTPVPGNPNNDLIRKGLIDKLCTRKYGKGSSTTTTTTTTETTSATTSTTTGSPSVSTLSTSTSATAPNRRSRTRSRSARATRVTSTAAPTFEPSCSDFDDLSFEQLMKRNKAGLRPVRRRESSLKSNP